MQGQPSPPLASRPPIRRTGVHDVATPAQLPGPAHAGDRPPPPVQEPDTAAVGQSAWVPPTWDEIVRTHSARVFRLALRLTGDRHDAEDLTQEVFVRVFRSLGSYTPGTFEGWLHRITTNLFLDLVRRKQRIRFDALPDDAGPHGTPANLSRARVRRKQRTRFGALPGDAGDRLASREPSPEHLLVDSGLDPDVEAALAALSPDFRAAVVLCDIEGLSYEEIAATLGVKLGTVRSRIHRGRALLRAALAHRDPSRRATEDHVVDVPALAEEPA